MRMKEEQFSLDSLKECKFLIPMRLHVQLHRHRVLTGQAISETVSRALDTYLEEILPDNEQQV